MASSIAWMPLPRFSTRSNLLAGELLDEVAKCCAIAEPVQVAQALSKSAGVLTIDVPLIAVPLEKAHHRAFRVSNPVRVSGRLDALPMFRFRPKNAGKQALVKQEPRFKLAFNANGEYSTTGHSVLAQSVTDPFSLMAPAQDFVSVRPRRTFVPKDDNALTAVGEKIACGGAALFQQPIFVIHRYDLLHQLDAQLLRQQLANAAAHVDF
jgi:hypothetical protein